MIWTYWGNPIMSFLRYMTLHSLCALNDHVTLITNDAGRGGDWPEKQDMNHYTGPDYTSWLPNLKNLSIVHIADIAPDIHELEAPEIHKSDLLAWHLMATRGGTVTDMDIVYVKPVPRIKADMQLIRFGSGYIPVSFMQGRPNDIWAYLLELAFFYYDANDYESCGNKVFDHVGTWPADTVWQQARLISPFRDLQWGRRHKMVFRGRRKLHPKTIGIHWHGGANLNHNNRIRHDNPEPTTIWEAIKVTYEG